MQKKEKQEEKLTTRQWDLYKFLKSQYADGVFLSKYDICNALPQHYQINDIETRKCRTLERDIRALNDSNIIQKIIVSNRKGYKIGNKDEVDEYLSRRFKRDWNNIALNRKLCKKASLDGQTILTFGTKERNYFEAFIKQ